MKRSKAKLVQVDWAAAKGEVELLIEHYISVNKVSTYKCLIKIITITINYKLYAIDYKSRYSLKLFYSISDQMPKEHCDNIHKENKDSPKHKTRNKTKIEYGNYNMYISMT